LLPVVQKIHCCVCGLEPVVMNVENIRFNLVEFVFLYLQVHIKNNVSLA